MSDRPKTRADCQDGPRPCPWVSCRYHLAIHVRDASIHLEGRRKKALTPRAISQRVARFTDGAADVVTALSESCALDVADKGIHTLEEIAAILGGITRERVRQLENTALRKLKTRIKG